MSLTIWMCSISKMPPTTVLWPISSHEVSTPTAMELHHCLGLDGNNIGLYTD